LKAGTSGQHVAQFVEDCPELCLHVVLARQHAVDGVQRHPDEQRSREQQQQRGPVGIASDHAANKAGESQRRLCDVIRRHMGGGQRASQRAQEILESRFELVDTGHSNRVFLRIAVSVT
jgi:hypothetical protein